MLEVVALVFAPLLGLLGVYVGYVLNSRREDRVLRRDLALERYRAGQELFEEVTASAGTRFTTMQRWLWSIEDPEPYRDVPARAEYFALLQGWNASCWSRRARLRLMLGDEAALRFLDYRDDGRDDPQSLHYRFVAAHGAILGCERHRERSATAQAQLDRLNHAWSDFADDIAVELTKRSSALA